MKKSNILIIFLVFGHLFFAACLPKQPLVSPKYPDQKNTASTGVGKDTKEARGATSISGLEYIERYQQICIDEMNIYGIPASIKMAQALLESGNGGSKLAREANNHFGIKCAGDWQGGKVYHDDDATGECFRAYSDAQQSFRDHSLFLQRKRYEGLFLLDKKDYKAWAHGLKQAGYATNPLYANLLIDLIERYELYKLDNYALNKIASNQIQVEIKPQSQTQTQQKNKENNTKSTKMIIHEVVQGETVESIASKYNMSVQELVSANSLKSSKLDLGQMLVISK